MVFKSFVFYDYFSEKSASKRVLNVVKAKKSVNKINTAESTILATLRYNKKPSLYNLKALNEMVNNKGLKISKSNNTNKFLNPLAANF